MASSLDLIEFTDGIHVRVTPRLPLPGGPYLPGDIVRCEHCTPLIIDKHQYGYRLAYSSVAGVDVTRGAAAHEAPRCGCWLLLAIGTIEPVWQKMMVAKVGA